MFLIPPFSRPVLVLIIAALTAACTSTQTACSAPEATRELATLDRLIDETQQNLARGFAYERAPANGINLCLGGMQGNFGMSYCTNGSRRTAVPVDAASEQRKLDNLRARRDALNQSVATQLAACNART